MDKIPLNITIDYSNYTKFEATQLKKLVDKVLAKHKFYDKSTLVNDFIEKLKEEAYHEDEIERAKFRLKTNRFLYGA
jgi:hypothetical protein